jgi:hypothetical protein
MRAAAVCLDADPKPTACCPGFGALPPIQRRAELADGDLADEQHDIYFAGDHRRDAREPARECQRRFERKARPAPSICRTASFFVTLNLPSRS